MKTLKSVTRNSAFVSMIDLSNKRVLREMGTKLTRNVLRTIRYVHHLWTAGRQIDHVFQHTFLDWDCSLCQISNVAYLQRVISSPTYRFMLRYEYNIKSGLRRPSSFATFLFIHSHPLLDCRRHFKALLIDRCFNDGMHLDLEKELLFTAS